MELELVADMELDLVADMEVDKVTDMVAGHGCCLIGPKLVQPEFHPILQLPKKTCAGFHAYPHLQAALFHTNLHYRVDQLITRQNLLNFQ